MDAMRFDRLARSMGQGVSRRSFARGIAPAVLGSLWMAAPGAGKGKKHKVARNAFGCADVGNPCRGKDANCCSGICEGKKPKQGKKDKSRCVAHNALNCPPGSDSCAGSPAFCGFGFNGACVQTTGKASFCGLNPVCTDCRKDTDCNAITGPGSACIVCAINCPSAPSTACLHPVPA